MKFIRIEGGFIGKRITSNDQHCDGFGVILELIYLLSDLYIMLRVGEKPTLNANADKKSPDMMRAKD